MKLQQLFLTIFVRPHDPLMLIVCKLSLCVSLSGWCMYYSGRQLVLSTTGNPTIKENIVNCFGLKQVNNIIIDTDWSLCGIAFWNWAIPDNRDTPFFVFNSFAS